MFAQGAPMNLPNGIEVDAAGNVVVVNIGTADVITYAPDGTPPQDRAGRAARQ